jgi:CD109 antigen
MKNKWMKIASVFLAVITVALALPACQKITAADSYMAIVPGILHIGRAEAVSLSLLSNGKPVTDIVDVVLLKDGKKVTNTSQTVSGTGTVTLNIPKNAAEGKYEVMVKGTGFTDKAPVSLEKTDMVFLETDKPIYKPGQTINMRVLTLDADLKPLTETATIEVLDAKGIKIFRTDVTTGWRVWNYPSLLNRISERGKSPPRRKNQRMKLMYRSMNTFYPNTKLR